MKILILFVSALLLNGCLERGKSKVDPGFNPGIDEKGTNPDDTVVGPKIINVTSGSGNGTFKLGDTVSVHVVFDEAVNVTGTPRITLSSGATVGYSSGTGTATLVFSYTVAAGQTSADLDYAGTGSLALNG